MRTGLAGLLSVTLLWTPLASAQPCAKPADLSAFDIAGLKSHLMITALTCKQHDRYNDFIRRFQSDLMAQEHALHAYFARAFGGSRAQREHDDYITSLANAQSQSGIKQGTSYCQRNVGVFTEVMVLQKGVDLVRYATGKAPVQPIEVIACPVRPPVTRTAQANIARR